MTVDNTTAEVLRPSRANSQVVGGGKSQTQKHENRKQILFDNNFS